MGTGRGPCDACGSDDDCRCPPCPCIWCRYNRGEANMFERARVERHMEAIRRADLRASAARMLENMTTLSDKAP